jgi:HSP20 family protein
MIALHFDPFRELSTLQHRVNRSFGERYTPDAEHGTPPVWVPPVDVYETAGNDLVIKAELPDLSREDIAVTVEQNRLAITGTKHAPVDVPGDRVRRSERRYGTFRRSFTLPNTVDASKVSADYKNGVLTITLPYKEESKPRTIAVEVAA